MINPNEALNLIQGLIVPQKVQKIAIQDALGLILAEDLRADRDFPPFNRAMMDGIAIKNTAIKKWLIVPHLSVRMRKIVHKKRYELK